jgi:hypothetical protein
LYKPRKEGNSQLTDSSLVLLVSSGPDNEQTSGVGLSGIGSSVKMAVVPDGCFRTCLGLGSIAIIAVLRENKLARGTRFRTGLFTGGAGGLSTTRMLLFVNVALKPRLH